MYIWILFLFVVSLLLYYYYKAKSKKKVLFLIVFFLIYFSAFRDGLGQDYSNYLLKMTWAERETFDYLSEPAFTILALLVNKTSLSAVVFFLVTSAITIYGICDYLFDNHNKYVVASVLIFCLMPTLFFNTFNLVRQFVATGIFMFSLHYVYKQQFLKYATLIVLASFFHLSALLLIPLYYLIYKKRPLYAYVIIGIVFYLASVNTDFLLRYSYIFDERYGRYVSTEEQMGNSIMIFIYNILGILLLLKREKLKDTYHIVTVNVFVLLVVMSDLSFVNFYFFRLSVYFVPSFCVVFPLVIKLYSNNKAASFYIPAFVSLYLFIFSILGNYNNPKICPSEIQLPTALIDGYYDYNKYYKRIDGDF